MNKTKRNRKYILIYIIILTFIFLLSFINQANATTNNGTPWEWLDLDYEVLHAQIHFPIEYFTNTSIISWNISEIKFPEQFNWFWLFFLWTWKTVNAKLNLINGEEITCHKQLNWYYTINFTDFWMFPLDADTLNITSGYSATTWVNILAWWLFYDCHKLNNSGDFRKWVYGYIKREYWATTPKNQHEIRAWLWTDAHTRATTSPLSIVYSPVNNWNTARGLNGYFFSSLIGGASADMITVTPKFFGDVWFEDVPIIQDLNTVTYILDNETLTSEGYTLFLKSSFKWANAESIIITGHDIDGNTNVATINNEPLTNTRNDFWFLWYKGINFSSSSIAQLQNALTWEIKVKIVTGAAERTKKIFYAVTWPIFKLSYNPEDTGMCTQKVTVKVLPSLNAGTRWYKRWNLYTSWALWYYSQEFTWNWSWQVQVRTPNNPFGRIYSWEELYLNLTNIDSSKPTMIMSTGFIWEDWYIHTQWYECYTGFITGILQDNDCWSGNITVTIWEANWPNQMTWSEINYYTWFGDIPSLNNYADKYISYSFTDLAWNNTAWTEKFRINNAKVVAHDLYLSIHKVWNRYEGSWNRKSLANAYAGACEDVEITKVDCHQNWTITTWAWHRLTYTYNWDNTNNLRCDIRISDWDRYSNASPYSTYGIKIKWHFVDCDANPDECKPELTTTFVWWDRFIEYNENNVGDGLTLPSITNATETRKFTSWSNVEANVHITKNVAQISRFRYSCIGTEYVYCDKLDTRSPCSNLSTDYYDICSSRSDFINNWGYTPQKCDDWHIKSSWKPTRISWNGRDVDQSFRMDLESDCSISNQIPYQSKYEWKRQLWIEMEDVEGHVGHWLVEANSWQRVLYSIERPYIVSWHIDSSIYASTITGTNQPSFTVNVTAVGATLPQWEIWDDENALNSNSTRGQFLRILPPEIDNRWLQSRYK